MQVNHLKDWQRTYDALVDLDNSEEEFFMDALA
jgi:hypothetical protein